MKNERLISWTCVALPSVPNSFLFRTMCCAGKISWTFLFPSLWALIWNIASNNYVGKPIWQTWRLSNKNSKVFFTFQYIFWPLHDAWDCVPCQSSFIMICRREITFGITLSAHLCINVFPGKCGFTAPIRPVETHYLHSPDIKHTYVDQGY